MQTTELEEMQIREKAFAENVRQVFTKDPIGKALLADMIDSYQNRRSFSTDPLQMAFNEGQRSVVLHLLSIIEEGE